MAPTKNLLLRLDPALAAELQTVAEVEERPVSEVVREAIRDLVDARRHDEEFQTRLRAVAREQQQLIRRLRAER